ncbi:MAG: hypothetical protein JNL63_12125, partial [Bacteroidia bacterium]|nr:hypothetical protein [Bacteroidia bacterium]
MAKYIYTFSTIAFLFICNSGFAQSKLQPLLDQLTYSAQSTPGNGALRAAPKPSSYSPHIAQLFKLTEKYRTTPASIQNNSYNVNRLADTLWVGKPITTNDTLNITGAYSTNGFPIVVIGNGVLNIHKANMTNIGDIIVFGGFGNPKVNIDSSTIDFPQTYFYERSIIMVGSAYMNIKNTTLDYSNLSHNVVVTDSAQLFMSKITMKGWITAGISRKGAITINGINQAGEYIIYDRCKLDLKNSSEVLLWHQFPDTAVINWSFGKSDTAYNYRFNKTKTGVKGVEYDVKADSCYKVMWAMMPASSSNVTVSNSKIRAIGLWFDHQNDSIQVTGIFDSTNYVSNTIPLSDRVLKLNNCYVQTWSLYTFYKSKINVSNCKVGEIGSQQTSRVYGNNYLVDGTGGYHWTTDSAVAFANNITVYTYVRSEKTSLFILGYSLVVNAEAIGKSILFVVQTALMTDPVAREGAVAWYNTIDQPAPVYANSTANITGSAWIDRGPTSVLMDFKSWRLYYQKQGDVTWKAITPDKTTEVRHNLLGTWNTTGLTPGTYILRMNLRSTWGDSIDAFLGVNVLPALTGTHELNSLSGLHVYPNPATENVNISFASTSNQKIKIILTDLLGKEEYVNESYN